MQDFDVQLVLAEAWSNSRYICLLRCDKKLIFLNKFWFSMCSKLLNSSPAGGSNAKTKVRIAMCSKLTTVGKSKKMWLVTVVYWFLNRDWKEKNKITYSTWAFQSFFVTFHGIIDKICFMFNNASLLFFFKVSQLLRIYKWWLHSEFKAEVQILWSTAQWLWLI